MAEKDYRLSKGLYYSKEKDESDCFFEFSRIDRELHCYTHGDSVLEIIDEMEFQEYLKNLSKKGHIED